MKYFHTFVILVLSLTLTLRTPFTMPRNPKDFKWLERHGLVAVPTRGDGELLPPRNLTLTWSANQEC